MKNRPIIQRRLLRRVMRKQMHQSNENQRDMIRVALVDDAIFETLYEEAMIGASEYATRTSDFSMATADDGSPVVDNLLKLLNWFLDNGPELVRMIELIVGLFGSVSIASAACQIEHNEEPAS